ncbi:dCTP pyrophosphatase 1 [Forsythia ovata]|uniref:dCTP pyrophosphatase 1 n=1 Tax=Forsythia ovata TaxID=205694 RepID=A0ABD1V325_9LAMI
MNGASGEGRLTLEDLKEKMANFAKERDWDQFHSPRNLLLALWKDEVPRGLPNWEEQEKLHLGEELSDVLLYLVRLSDNCGIDLCKAVLRKLELNAIKYPIGLCKGSSKKHNQIKTSPETTATVAGAAADATTSTTSNDMYDLFD